MNWIVVVGFAALIVLVLSCILLLFTLRHRRDIRPLPDGDYFVTMVGVRETPLGVETTYKVDEPVELRGRTVKVVQEKANSIPDEEVSDA